MIITDRRNCFIIDYVIDRMIQLYNYMFQTEVMCAPQDVPDGGIPAGCQCDLDNSIWVADMRLGILHMDPSGNFKQVFVNALVNILSIRAYN